VTTTATINGQKVTVLPKQTLLQAALKADIDFPNSCRVGGCASCKCQLVSGQVKQHTETAYLLSADELDAGFILACQSVPLTDVDVQVALPTSGASGVVVQQERVTHDITHLTVQLHTPIEYRAGQFTPLTFAGLPGVTRPYSLATPARSDGRVEFYVRRVPGGQLSTHLVDEDVRGEIVHVAAPRGDFYLRDDTAPLLMVAGGSGLPPILAILDDAANAGCTRDVTLVFGAREQKDLYALEQIANLQARWRGAFTFAPVLSAANDDVTWQGARGFVHELLSDIVTPHTHAYLCGPHAMIDAAADVLQAAGVAREHIRADRFTAAPAPTTSTTTTTTTTSTTAATASIAHYLKYFLFHGVGLAAAVALLAGGSITTLGLLAIVAFYVLGDAFGGDDTSTPTFTAPHVLTAQLWLALPVLATVVFSSVWSVCSTDVGGFGAWLTALSGYDVVAARAGTSVGDHIAGFILTGLMIGTIGTIPAHELTHRTWDPISMLVGRWLLAFSFDTSFAIEHVYGHHRYVSTSHDPATAPRGRNVYVHVVSSTIKGNVSAWHIEAERLARLHLPVWSSRNAVLRGYAMSAAIVVVTALLGGPLAAAWFIACGLLGKALLEIVNYMEHYGLVRSTTTPVAPRHSWNTNRRLSSWTMFNLTRHSHHHAQGEVPYQNLRPYPDAPMMIGGYLTTILVALVPPVWHRLMAPRLHDWDTRHATDEERELLRAPTTSGAA
jgi:NAD(P)H-flavin reductase/ferredoxin